MTGLGETDPAMGEPGDGATVLAGTMRSGALIRRARSVVRRVDSLRTTAKAGEPESVPEIAEARDAVTHLVLQLVERQQSAHHQHATRVRRGRAEQRDGF